MTELDLPLVRLYLSLYGCKSLQCLVQTGTLFHFLAHSSLFLSESLFRWYPTSPIIYTIILKHHRLGSAFVKALTIRTEEGRACGNILEGYKIYHR